MEYFKNLVALDLSHNNIEDIKPLSALSNLTNLSMYNNAIKDVSPLSGLSQLRNLGLGNNDIADIAPLASLRQLEDVNLSYNELSTVEPLKENSNIFRLALAGNELTEIKQFNNFKKLRMIDASENAIADVSGSTIDPERYFVMTSEYINEDVSLPAGGGMVTLTMPVNHEGKFIAPSEISTGGTYDAATGKVTWENVTEPKQLVAKFMIQIPSVSNDKPYSGGVYRTVSVGGKAPQVYTLGSQVKTDVEDVDKTEDEPATAGTPTNCTIGTSTYAVCIRDHVLADAVAAQAGKSSSDIVEKSDVDRITKVAASYKGITSLEGLEHFTALESIVMDGNPIESLEPIRGLNKIKYASFYECKKITDASPLGNKPELDGIALGGNSIQTLDGLVNLPKLTWIDLYGNQIVDVAPLGNIPSLVNVWLSGNKISDISPLARLSNLKKLQLEWNRIMDMTPMQHISPDEYSMNALQQIEENTISIAEGETLELPLPKDRNGQVLTPYDVSQGGWTIDRAAGKIVWKNVSKTGAYTYRFSTSSDNDFLYAGRYGRRVEVDHHDKNAPTIWGAWDTFAPLGESFDVMEAVTASDPEEGNVDVHVLSNNLDTNKAGTYEVMYEAADSSQNYAYAKRKITVAPDVHITNIAAADMTTEVGVAPNLYKLLLATWSNGAQTREGVVWNKLDPSAYARPNTFTVEGTSRGKKDYLNRHRCRQRRRYDCVLQSS
ncbi:leucine-rich repeat domain-containing protein [Bifidobacterium pseudolongum]|uniref:leucine-rich repeat domain-containing protein n=1 Tax=Bifidobacterium pseudolongum TaxID=1694 RepID=UPI00214AF739|nr:leucine-rich repeat domain-containing protein [Bifidobacterium pseudolongum]